MPIRWRLTLFIALAIGVILLALGLTLYLLIRGTLHKDVEDTAKNRAEAVAQAIEGGDNLSTAPDDDDQVLFDDSVAVIVWGKNGKVIDKFNLPAGGSAPDFDVWRKALKNGQDASDKSVRLGDNDYYVYAVAMDPSARPARVVEFGKSYNKTEEILEIFGTVLAFVIGGTLLLSIGGAYQLAGAALRPVDSVTSAASRMGEGDLSKRSRQDARRVGPRRGAAEGETKRRHHPPGSRQAGQADRVPPCPHPRRRRRGAEDRAPRPSCSRRGGGAGNPGRQQRKGVYRMRPPERRGRGHLR